MTKGNLTANKQWHKWASKPFTRWMAKTANPQAA
jgi:hypothetical protein